MTNRTLAACGWLLLCGISTAAECPLANATYTEAKSGAVLQFHPKDPTTDATLTTGLFDLHLPNIKQSFAGDITWNAGNNARPDGDIAQDCTDADRADNPDACSLWFGNVYSVGNESVDLLADAEMMAPKAILLVDFGRTILMTEKFVIANPDSFALDLFTLTGCTL